MISMSKNRTVSTTIIYLLLISGAAVFIVPLVWMITRSVMGLKDLYNIPPRILPSRVIFEAYFEIWEIAPLHLYIWNTIIIEIFSIIGVTVSATLCAYGFASLRFPFKNLIFGILLSTTMLPAAVTIIPVYILFSKFGWLNTNLPLIIPCFFGGGAFSIFLLRQFFASIPRDFDEAARIYGANTFKIFIYIAVPMCKPAITVVIVNTFLAVWNDFMGPLLYLNKMNKFTLALGLSALSPSGIGVVNGVNTAQIMAICSISIIPVIIVFFIAQNRLISGISIASGIKG